MVSEQPLIGPWAFGSLVRKLRFKQFAVGGLRGAINIVMTALLTIALVTFAIIAVMASRADEDGAAFVAAGLAVTLVAWTVLPVAFAGGNTAVDPQLYAMYPIRRSTLSVGLLSAAFVSFPSFGAAMVAASTLSYAHSVLGVFVIVLAAALAVLTAVLSSQTVMLFFSSAMQRRSTKDFAAALGAVAAVSLAMLPQVIASSFENGADVVLIRRVVTWLNTAMAWTPWGWAPLTFRAGADEEWLRAGLFGLLSLGWIGALFFLWTKALHRSLIERPAKATTAKSSALVSGFQQRLLGSPLAAVSARSLRELYRDARQLAELAGWLPLVVFAAVPGWDAIRTGADELVLASSLVGIAVGTTGMNLFGFDGPSFGLDVLVDHDVGLALRGKLVARIELGLAVVTVVSVALAAITGGWRFVPTSIVFGVCGLLAELAIGAILSVRFPYPVPPKAGTSSMFYNPGCLNQFVRGAGLFGVVILIGPIVGPATYLSVERSAAFGFGVAAVGLVLVMVAYRSCEQWAERRLAAVAPEMFQVLSTVG